MKLRESGMPEESFWETLFDVNLILGPARNRQTGRGGG